MEQRLISKKLPNLKIINKGAHVESYEEVDKKEVPKKALAIIG